MSEADIDAWLQRCYWISQIMLVLIAAGAAFAALRQVRLFKLFEILKYLETADVRSGRRIVLYKLIDLKGTKWWEDVALETAARNLATAYDHLGSLLQYSGIGKMGRWFIHRWGETIVKSHLILEDYLEYRRLTTPGAYQGYTWLYRQARRYYPDLSLLSHGSYRLSPNE